MLEVKHIASSSCVEPSPSEKQLVPVQDVGRATALEGRSLRIARFARSTVHRQPSGRPWAFKLIWPCPLDSTVYKLLITPGRQPVLLQDCSPSYLFLPAGAISVYETSRVCFFLPWLIRANRCQCSLNNKRPRCCSGLCFCRNIPRWEFHHQMTAACLGEGENGAKNSIGVLGEAGEALAAKNTRPSIFKNTFEGPYKHTDLCWQNKTAHLCCVLSLKTCSVCAGSPMTTPAC